MDPHTQLVGVENDAATLGKPGKVELPCDQQRRSEVRTQEKRKHRSIQTHVHGCSQQPYPPRQSCKRPEGLSPDAGGDMVQPHGRM